MLVALEMALNGQTHVCFLAEDTDILVLLLHHWQQCMNDVFFLSQAKKERDGKQIDCKCISIKAAQGHLGTSDCLCLPAVHAFEGCDTTSAIFGHGKGSVYSQLTSTEQLQHCKTLQSESAIHEDVITPGLRLMVAVHGGSDTVTLAVL